MRKRKNEQKELEEKEKAQEEKESKKKKGNVMLVITRFVHVMMWPSAYASVL